MSPESRMVDALQEGADFLIDLIEAKKGLKHRRHQVHLKPARATIQALFSGAFRRQGPKVLEAIEPHIRSHIEQYKEASDQGKRFANSLVPESLHPLRLNMSAAEELVYDGAITQAIEGAGAVLSAELARDITLAPNVATSYLRANSLSKLTGELTKASKDELRRAIGDAWDAGGAYDQIVGAIQDTFEDFSTTRAELIAQTETVDAYNAGRRATADAAGLNEKAWETESGDPCEICIANEEEGWIPIDQAHQSGDQEPTAHPRCECVENYRSVSDADADEG